MADYKVKFDWLGYLRLVVLVVIAGFVFFCMVVLADIRYRLDSFDVPTTTTTEVRRG